MPTISIITPLYNKAPYIAATIHSVLAQTYSNWELWIVDNGSIDSSWEIAQQLPDPRIHLLRAPKQGPGAARNYGLSYAQGEWIQFLDADDLLEPNHLAQQLQAAQQDPVADIIACCWQEFIDENPTVKKLKQPAGMGRSPQELRDAVIAFAPWAVHAAIIKHSAFTPECYWPEQLDCYLGEDIAFWFRLVSSCRVAYGTSQGALYRTQTAECRSQISNPKKWFEGVHAAIVHNQQVLQQAKTDYTSAQCENLMRVYVELYRLACQQQVKEVAELARLHAEAWLREYFRVVRKPKLSMVARRLIGIKPFLK
uniref:glycosyltransferase family 2 protein n=1 Tax=Trichocoleus desertorum TaxID=1481672 RepID=UPI0025B4CC24|nr:glycosyltransferase family A protein [Trichocoleus desertorum]